jgi:cobalt-zinc-cadmium efflux system membrane fusion protein
MAMKRTCLLTLLVLLSSAAIANDDDALVLSSAELARLGVEFDSPESSELMEVGSGPAEVVIPPTQQVIVGTTVSGVLSRLLVAEGETVVADQAMAEIESPALLALQRAYVNADAANELAQVQLQRDRGLREDGIIAERRLQETSASAAAAAVALDQGRQQLQLAGMSAGQLRTLSEQQQLSSSLTLRSPITGVVVSQLSSLGSQVDALGPVFQVADLTRLWLEVRVSQQQAAKISIGMQVTVPDFDDKLSAMVFHVGPVVDSVSQTVMIRAVLQNEHLLLRPGQYLSARIVANASGEGSTYTVPSNAIVRDGADTFVFVQAADGISVRRVRLLSDNGRESYVASNLRPDSKVVTAGVAALKSIWLEDRAER